MNSDNLLHSLFSKSMSYILENTNNILYLIPIAASISLFRFFIYKSLNYFFSLSLLSSILISIILCIFLAVLFIACNVSLLTILIVSLVFLGLSLIPFIYMLYITHKYN